MTMHTETTVWLDGVTPEVPPVPVPYRPRLLRLGDLTLVLPEAAVASAEMADELIACLNIIRSNALRELALRDAEWAATQPFDEEAVGAAERTERDEGEEGRTPWYGTTDSMRDRPAEEDRVAS